MEIMNHAHNDPVLVISWLHHRNDDYERNHVLFLMWFILDTFSKNSHTHYTFW